MQNWPFKGCSQRTEIRGCEKHLPTFQDVVAILHRKLFSTFWQLQGTIPKVVSTLNWGSLHSLMVAPYRLTLTEVIIGAAQVPNIFSMLDKWLRVFNYVFLVVPSLDFMLEVKSSQKLIVHISPYSTLWILQKSEKNTDFSMKYPHFQ